MCMFTFLPSSPFPQIQAVTRVGVGEFSQPIPLTIEGSYNSLPTGNLLKLPWETEGNQGSVNWVKGAAQTQLALLRFPRFAYACYTGQICQLVFARSRNTSRFPSYSGWPTTRQTDEEDLYLKACSKKVIVSVFACKLKDFTNSRGSYPLADTDTTLMQVHSIFVGYTCH